MVTSDEVSILGLGGHGLSALGQPSFALLSEDLASARCGQQRGLFLLVPHGLIVLTELLQGPCAISVVGQEDARELELLFTLLHHDVDSVPAPARDGERFVAVEVVINKHLLCDLVLLEDAFHDQWAFLHHRVGEVDDYWR